MFHSRVLNVEAKINKVKIVFLLEKGSIFGIGLECLQQLLAHSTVDTVKR